jgi:hypothetical protein
VTRFMQDNPAAVLTIICVLAALWLTAVVFVLALCQAAATGDRLAHVPPRGGTVDGAGSALNNAGKASAPSTDRTPGATR